jgi:hypothetical protein
MTAQMELDFSGVEQAEANSDSWWWSGAMVALKHFASLGTAFDAYDLTLEGVPDPQSTGQWGALFNAGRKAGLIEAVGYERSRRPGRSGGACRVWRGCA